MSDLRDIINKTVNIRGFENLERVLGKELGSALIILIKEADRADRELDLIHNTLTELYNLDNCHDIIKKCLNKISNLQG